MAKKIAAPRIADDAELVIEDAEFLTPTQLAQERKALLEERAKRAWMADSPEQLARRIPVSVFAMGDLT